MKRRINSYGEEANINKNTLNSCKTNPHVSLHTIYNISSYINMVAYNSSYQAVYYIGYNSPMTERMMKYY